MREFRHAPIEHSIHPVAYSRLLSSLEHTDHMYTTLGICKVRAYPTNPTHAMHPTRHEPCQSTLTLCESQVPNAQPYLSFAYQVNQSNTIAVSCQRRTTMMIIISKCFILTPVKCSRIIIIITIIISQCASMPPLCFLPHGTLERARWVATLTASDARALT